MYKLEFTESGKGVIKIDSFEEYFECDLSYWTQDQYEKHWQLAEETINQGNKACFITSITNPDNSNFVRTWACYPIQNKLVFQEVILFLDDLPFTFNTKSPHLNVQAYESVTEDGDKISEWTTSA
jgi:hypothetical protein